MSALLIDLPLAEVPAAARPGRWVHVVPEPHDAPVRLAEAVPARRESSGASVLRPAAIALEAPLRLTRRGLAVVVGGFGLLMMTALVVLVVSFLAVSNEPLVAQFPLG